MLNFECLDSGLGGEARLSLRGKAVGMVTAVQTVRKVADEIGVHYSTVSRWCSKHKAGEPLSDKKRCGRPSVQTKVSKMVLSKSLTKKRQSTRKLARRLISYWSSNDAQDC